MNALIGFVQEYRAGRSIRALMDIVPRTASVLRAGLRRTVPAAELVRGDVVVLEPGDKPARPAFGATTSPHWPSAAISSENAA